jgi:acyl carrier protein
MIVNTLGLWTGRGAVGNISNLDIKKLRLLIAEYLQVHIRHVTEDAHLGRDLGADWVDRLELIMLVEDIAGLEITDNEADQIELVGDLIHYIDQTTSRSESSQRTQYAAAPCRAAGSPQRTSTGLHHGDASGQRCGETLIVAGFGNGA